MRYAAPTTVVEELYIGSLYSSVSFSVTSSVDDDDSDTTDGPAAGSMDRTPPSSLSSSLLLLCRCQSDRRACRCLLCNVNVRSGTHQGSAGIIAAMRQRGTTARSRVGTGGIISSGAPVVDATGRSFGGAAAVAAAAQPAAAPWVPEVPVNPAHVQQSQGLLGDVLQFFRNRDGVATSDAIIGRFKSRVGEGEDAVTFRELLHQVATCKDSVWRLLPKWRKKGPSNAS
jgi:hypothetical protein